VQADVAELQAVALQPTHPHHNLVESYLRARGQLNGLRTQIHNVVNRYGLQAAGLTELHERERNAVKARLEAEDQLAMADPGLAASVGALQPLSVEDVTARLGTDEAWLTIAPTQPPLAYLLRPSQPPLAVELGDLSAVVAASEAYCHARREGRHGQLRDILEPPHPDTEAATPPAPRPAHVKFPAFGTLGSDPAASTAWPQRPELDSREALTHARDLCRSRIWSTLEPHLAGVRRLHLVTAAGQHELMLEFALPPSLALLQVLRYSGLPAYQSSLFAVEEGTTSPLAASAAKPVFAIGDPAWDRDSPIPFTSLDAVVPVLRGRAQRIGSARLLEMLRDSPIDLEVMISAHGSVARTAAGNLGGGHVELPGGRALDPETLGAALGRIRWLMWMSCWAGRVVHGGHGEPYGAVSTLQLKGLSGGIGCLAPVADFYTPLLSAALWHERLQGADTATALQRAKARLLHGSGDDWPQDLIEALAEGYREVMQEVLRKLPPTGEPGRDGLARRLLTGIRSWSLPGSWRRRLQTAGTEAFWQWILHPQASDAEREQAHRELFALLPQTDVARRRFVDECVEVLLRPAPQRNLDDADEDAFVADEFRQLCAVVVVYGAR
jgi:hypothetical protein